MCSGSNRREQGGTKVVQTGNSCQTEGVTSHEAIFHRIEVVKGTAGDEQATAVFGQGAGAGDGWHTDLDYATGGSILTRI